MPNQNITQRRGGTSSSSGLPITNADIEEGSNRKRRRYKFDIHVSPYDRTSIVRWILLVVLSITIASFIWKPILTLAGLKSQSVPQHNNRVSNQEIIQSQRVTSHSNNIVHNSRALSQFSELSFALQNSDLVALYFAASWCPMSTPISIALDKAFGNSNDVLTSEKEGRKKLSIVYVSSDKTIEEYNEYIKNRNWLAVPFDSPQRNQLKRHFSTCAHRELKELGFDRKHEIPTIIIIDSKSQGVITTSGADHIDDMGEAALDHWSDMKRWIEKASDNIA